MTLVDDEDIDRLIEQIQQLIDAITRGPQQQQEEEKEIIGEGIDKWREGTRSEIVSSKEEYVRQRKISANSEDISVPSIDVNEVDLVDFLVDLYINRRENLEVISRKLSNRQWNEFWKRFAERSIRNSRAFLDVSNKEEQKLIEIIDNIDSLMETVDPGPSFFGINEVGGEVNVIEEVTPFNFLVIYNEHYNSSDFPDLSNEVESIKENLDVTEDSEQIEIITGDKDPFEFVIELRARAGNKSDLPKVSRIDIQEAREQEETDEEIEEDIGITEDESIAELSGDVDEAREFVEERKQEDRDTEPEDLEPLFTEETINQLKEEGIFED